MSSTQHRNQRFQGFQARRAVTAAAGLMLACATSGCTTQANTKPEAAANAVKTQAVVDFNSCAKPHYPDADLAARHEGTVTLAFLVAQDGAVGAAKVAKSSGFAGLDEAARVALAQCRFKPALVNGQPVEAWTPIQYVWTLR